MSHENAPNNHVTDEYKSDVFLTLTTAKLVAIAIELTETKDAIKRLEMELRSTVEPVTCATLQHSIHHLLELMQSELEKRKVFALEPNRAHYYQDDFYGVLPPSEATQTNALVSDLIKKAKPILGERVVAAFPSAYMDIVEAGRCLALNRNNAAIYHLMQVAEIGLRVLAWDRRVEVKRNKGKIIPLGYAQWGEMIGALENKKKEIDHWPRPKAVKEAAVRFYTHAILEVDSFNEIYRKHISHARNKLYETDVAISCWGHVRRFMETLAERMSEDNRSPLVWSKRMIS